MRIFDKKTEKSSLPKSTLKSITRSLRRKLKIKGFLEFGLNLCYQKIKKIRQMKTIKRLLLGLTLMLLVGCSQDESLKNPISNEVCECDRVVYIISPDASIQYNDVLLSSPLVPVTPYTDGGTFTLVDNVLTSSSTTPDFISIEYKIIPTDLTLPYDAKIVYENGNTVVSNSQQSFTNQTGINYLYFNNFYTRFEPGVITNRIKAQISPKFTNTFNVEVKCIRRNAPTGATIYTWVTSSPNVNTFNADVKVEPGKFITKNDCTGVQLEKSGYGAEIGQCR
jgi:hypothetical protein